MFTLSAIILVMSIVSISMIVQGADAQDWVSPKMTTCVTNFTSAAAGAGRDRNKTCSAANTYLNCLRKVVTDCMLDSGSSLIKQSFATAKQALSQAGCGGGANGAGSLVFNFVAIVSGLTFYKLF